MTVLVYVEKQTHEFVFEPFWKLQLFFKWVRRNKGFEGVEVCSGVKNNDIQGQTQLVCSMISL